MSRTALFISFLAKVIMMIESLLKLSFLLKYQLEQYKNWDIDRDKISEA